MSLKTADIIKLRAAVNKWVSEKFPQHRKYLSHEQPKYCAKQQVWSVALGTKNVNGHSVVLGNLLVNADGVVVPKVRIARIVSDLEALLAETDSRETPRESLTSDLYNFRLGDGIEGVKSLADGEIDLLLTDPLWDQQDVHLRKTGS